MTCVFALLFAAAAPALAVEPKPPAAAPTPARKPADATPQARAFLAFSEADRKAAQEALGWLGFYNGVDDGAFGKRTIEALTAYQQSVGAEADGIMTAKGIAALKDGSAKAKAAVGYRIIDEPATGVRIGAPTKLLEKWETGVGSASLVSKDGTVGLYFKETKGDLATLYKALSADAGARKVTYKYLKPDAFFVTAGEDGENKFYRRYAVSGDKLRGFAFVYPKKRAKALDPAECKTPMVSGKPARFLGGQGPLVRLGGEFGAGAAPPPIGQGGGELVALSLGGAVVKPMLAVSIAQPAPGGQGQVIGAFGSSASGAPLFDRQGRLVAFVAANQASPRRAGVALAAPHAVIPAAALGEAAEGEAGATLTAADIARLRRGAIVGVFCPA